MTAGKAHFVGTDIGTLGTKSIVVDAEGKILAADYAEYGILTPRPLWAEQWPDVWLDAACRTIRGALAKAAVSPSSIGAATISGLYGGSGIPVDQEMTPLRPCLIWMDRRATKEVDWVRSTIGEEAIFKVTANYIDSYHGFTKILWIKNNEPDIWRRIHRLMTPYGYVTYRLTGSESMDYCSAGNLAGIFDMQKRDWSVELMESMSIPRHFFPDRLNESSEVVGAITAEGSRLTDLPEGTPLCAGGVDAAVATLSAGAFGEGDHVAMIGTSMAYGVIHDGRHYSSSLINMPHVADPKSRVYSFAGSATAGALIKWFREQFGQTEKLLAGTLDLDPYDILNLEAAKVAAGSDNLLVLPSFMGERAPIWDVNARGTVFGLTLYHTRAHLYRACMEAVAYSLRNCIEFGQSLGIQLKSELALVGGVTKSSLWKAIFADVTKFPVVCVSGGGEAAYGDAFLAAYGAGAVSEYEAIKEWIEFETPIAPDPAAGKIYDRLFPEYRELYRTLAKNMERIAALGEKEETDS